MGNSLCKDCFGLCDASGPNPNRVRRLSNQSRSDSHYQPITTSPQGSGPGHVNYPITSYPNTSRLTNKINQFFLVS